MPSISTEKDQVNNLRERLNVQQNKEDDSPRSSLKSRASGPGAAKTTLSKDGKAVESVTVGPSQEELKEGLKNTKNTLKSSFFTGLYTVVCGILISGVLYFQFVAVDKPKWVQDFIDCPTCIVKTSITWGEEQPMAEPEVPVEPVTEADLDALDDSDDEDDEEDTDTKPEAVAPSKPEGVCLPSDNMCAAPGLGANSTLPMNGTHIPVMPTNSTEPVFEVPTGSTRTDSAETATMGVEEDGFVQVEAEDEEDLDSEDEEDDRPRESNGMFGDL